MILNGKEAPDESFTDKFTFSCLRDAMSPGRFVILVLADSSYIVANYKADNLKTLKDTFRNKICRVLYNTLIGRVHFITIQSIN